MISKLGLFLLRHFIHILLHIPLVDAVGLRQGLLKDLDELVELLVGVLGHQAHPQAGLPDLHHWILNPIHMNTCITSNLP